MRRSAFTPIFEQLKGIIRAQIAEGQWKPGEKIHSERKLAQKLGVARLTVSRALNELSAEGILERRDSTGTFVAENALQRIGHRSEPLPANPPPARRDPHRQVHSQRGDHLHDDFLTYFPYF